MHIATLLWHSVFLFGYHSATTARYGESSWHPIPTHKDIIDLRNYK